MKYIYGLFVGLVTAVALGWVIHLGIQGKPVPKIKLSEFGSNQELARSIVMRLRQEIKDHSILFLGVDPEEPEHLEIWREVISELNEPGWKLDEVIVEKNLPKVSKVNESETILDIKENETRFKFEWQSPEFRSKRIGLIVPSIYSAQLIKDNPVHRVMAGPEDHRILSLTLVPMAQNAEAPEIQRIPCVAEGADYTGQSPLGCAIRNKSMFWKKPLKTGVRLGIVEQYGLNDYLVFFRKASK